MAYLTVDEQSTYIDVYCDGYVVRVYSNGSEAYLGKIYDPASVGTTDWFAFGSKVVVGGTTYAISEDTGITLEIIESTPIRVVVRVRGNFEDSSQNDLTNEAESIVYLYIYADRMVQKTIFNATDSITLSDSAVNGICFMDSITANIANEDSKYENADSEADAGGDGAQNSADYIATLSDECNVQGVLVDYSLGGGTSTLNQYIDDPGVALRFGWNNGTLTAVSSMVVVWIIDSADREYGSKKYSSTERLEMGDQYKDTTIDNPTTGSWADDLVIPANVGVDGFAADGAWHVDPSTGIAQWTWDMTRHEPKAVLHDPGVKTGTIGSETDHLLEYFKFNDNTTNNTVAAVTGNNGTWETSEGASRNTDNDSVVTGVSRDSGLDTADTYHVDCATTVYDNNFFKQGATILKFTPQFGYDDAADQTLFICYVDSDDYIQLVYDAGNDRYELRVSWGGTLQTIGDSAYTESDSLQQLTVLMAAWDSETNNFILSKNGQTVNADTNTGTPSTSGASYVHIGADSDGDGTTSLNADIILDDFKAFSGCLLPFGGGPFVGNGEVDSNLYHSDIIFHWDMDSVSDTAPNIGGVTLTKVGSPTATTGLNGNGITFTNGNCFYYSLSTLSFPESGTVSCWYKNTSALSVAGKFFAHGTLDSYLQFCRLSTDYTFRFSTSADYNWHDFTVSSNIFDGNWHFVALRYDIPDSWSEMWIDGIVEDSCDSADGTLITDYLTTGNLYIGDRDTSDRGINGIIDEFYITNNPNTPDRWSIFGTPINEPCFYKNGVLQKAGTGYQTARLSDGNLIYSDAGDVVA